MTENYQKVLELISDNEELKNKVEAIEKNASNIEEIVEKVNLLIKDSGLSISVDDLNASDEGDELDDGELETVAGGKMVETIHFSKRRLYSDCMCCAGGGGTKDEYQKACACVLAGAGELTEKGKKAAKEGLIMYGGKESSPVAMYCAVTGQNDGLF